MTWTYTEEYYKQYTRDTWNESAPHYGPVQRNLDLYNGPLFRLAGPAAGEHVLDCGTGPGEPALTLGRIVGPEGKVLGVDLSESMIEIARERAKALEAPNVSFEAMDAEALDVPDSSYDLVVNRFGLQIFTDPDKAIEEVFRVLKPGGRFATSVWASPGERCPAIDIYIAPMLEYAEPDETGYLPTPYEMGGDGELAAILEKAGFSDVTNENHTYDHRYETQAEYQAAFLDGTPIGHSLSEEDEDVQADVHKKAQANLDRYTFGSVVIVPSEAVFVRGVKPGEA